MANKFGFPFLGYGMGLRTPHYDDILGKWPENIDWFEIVSENFMDTGGRPIRNLEQVAAHYPIVMHGVSLSIGSTDPLDKEYLRKLKNLAEWVKPAWISDHLCWTGVQHKNTHDLLPVPYTKEALRHLADRVKKVQDYMGRAILLENPSTYMEFKDSAIPEWEFMAQLLEEADCGILLDANNIYVSCYNHRYDPKKYIDAIQPERVVQIHLAGHTHKGTHIVDTHDGRVVDEVWKLYSYIISRTGEVSTMVEWDDNIPAFAEVAAEVAKARKLVENLKAPNDIKSYEQPDSGQGAGRKEPYEAMLKDMQGSIISGDIKAAKPAEWIRSKKDFPPEEQLGVYVSGYRHRLFDIISEDFPALRYYLGDDSANELIDAYIEATSSTHFSVARYIEKFPQFVKSFEATRNNIFAGELAALETALTTVFDMEESKAFDPRKLAGINAEKLLELVIPLRKAIGLFAFTYPANAYYSDFMDEKNPPPPEQKQTYMAVFRDADDVWRIELEREEYLLLSAFNDGSSIGDAIEKVLPQSDYDETELTMKFQNWFGRWAQHNLLAEAV